MFPATNGGVVFGECGGVNIIVWCSWNPFLLRNFPANLWHTSVVQLCSGINTMNRGQWLAGWESELLDGLFLSNASPVLLEYLS